METLALLKKNVAEITMVVRDLFSESLNIQLLLEVFDHPYQSRRHYCKATAISEASFYRALRNINSVIEAYGFSIKHYQKGYYLHAEDEKELRLFLVSLYTETKTIDECFIRMPFQELKEIVSGYITEAFAVNCDLCNSYYSYFAYISLIRKSQGFLVNQRSVPCDYPEYKIIKQYFPHLKEKDLFSIRAGISQLKDPWSSQEEKIKVFKQFDQFIDEFLKLNKMNYCENIYQKLYLVCTLTYAGFELYPKRYKIVFNRVDLFIEQFKRKRLTTYKRFHKLFAGVNSALSPERQELCNQTLFFIGVLVPEFYTNKVEARLRIVSDLGHEHQKFYKDIFDKYFTDIIVLEVGDQERADFIISNYFLEEEDVPVLFVKDYPLRQDLLDIHEKILLKLAF